MPGYVFNDQKRVIDHSINADPGFVDVFKGPDDEDFLYKAGRMFRVTGVMTFISTSLDCILFSQTQNIYAAGARALYWGVPLIGGGLAYNATVTTVSGIRGGKSDKLNHFLGGCSAAAVMGAARKSIYFGVIMGASLGLMGMIFKESVEIGYRVLPSGDPIRAMRGNAFSHKMDFSWTPPYPKKDGFAREHLARKSYWARSEEEAKKLMEENDFDFRECINWNSK
jgi:hypothetical protein